MGATFFGAALVKKAGIAALVLVLGATALTWRFSGPGLRFPYATAVTPTDVSTLRGFSAWNVEVEPGVTLRGIKRVPGAADARWILFFHGNDAAQLASGGAFLRRLSSTNDLGLATVACRGFDGSGGEPSPGALRADALKVFDALSVPAAQVELMAFSFGAPQAVHLAAALSRRGTPPRALTLLAGAEALVMLPAVPWARLLRGDVYEVGDELEDVRCPVRIFHGLDDTTLPISQARSMARRLGARATLSELPGVTHATILTAPWAGSASLGP